MGQNKKEANRFLKNEVGYWMGIASGIITIFCAIFKDIPLYVSIVWASVIGICIIWFIIKFFIFLKNSLLSREELEMLYSNREKEKISVFYSQQKMCCDYIHKYLHNMRDYCSDYLKCSDENLEQICANVCSYIEQAFKALWVNEHVSVCIKRVIADNIMDNNFESWRVTTVARSAGSKQSRNNANNSEPLISENSDFKIIISPEYEDSVFSCMDLNRINEEFMEKYGEKYKNSTKNYLSNYQSTIVVPIRISSKKVNPKIKSECKDNLFHLVGFLCIDTDLPFSKEKILFETGIELARGFADAIYKLFENNILLKQHSKKESVKI